MWVGGGWWWVVGGMQANTETSRSSARARAATTMSIKFKKKLIFQRSEVNIEILVKDSM